MSTNKAEINEAEIASSPDEVIRATGLVYGNYARAVAEGTPRAVALSRMLSWLAGELNVIANLTSVEFVAAMLEESAAQMRANVTSGDFTTVGVTADGAVVVLDTADLKKPDKLN